MNRINQLFNNKEKNIISVYFTAGHPHLTDTETIICELEKNGANMIEIGMPFSDPLADGPVIQQSSQKALENGMSLHVLFNQIADIRKKVSIPLILMGYINPVMQFGIEKFCKKAAECGIDGIILPDLPFEEYITYYQKIIEKNNLHNIFLISPQTSKERIKKIDKYSNGFIYAVSSSSTTGSTKNFNTDQDKYLKKIQSLKLKNPVVVGFGIRDKETFTKACQFTNGAIIGTAFIKALEQEKSINESIKEFMDSILN